MNNDTLAIYPAWREALRNWPQSGYTWGDHIPHAWFSNAFNLPMIEDTMTVKEAQVIELKFLSQLTSFRDALLEDRQMYLAPVPGYGYEIISVEEASRRAYEEEYKGVRKHIRRMVRRLRFVPIGQMTDEQRRENADLLSRAASLQRMFKPIALSAVDVDDE